MILNSCENRCCIYTLRHPKVAQYDFLVTKTVPVFQDNATKSKDSIYSPLQRIL